MNILLRQIKSIIKNFIAYGLYYSGLLFILKHYKLKNKVIVLMYHRVLPEEIAIKSFSSSAIIVYPSTFERQLSFLKKHFNVLSLSQFHQQLDEKLTTTKPSCLITFDDGWVDNFTHALPLLSKLEIPATIFIPIDYIESNKLFWQESLRYKLFHLIKDETIEAKKILRQYHLLPTTLPCDISIKNSVLLFVDNLKKKPYLEIETVYNNIESVSRHQNKNTVDNYLTWDQISKMQDLNICFGSHTCSHRILTRISKQDLTKELNKSALKLNELSSSNAPLTIAYPNGDSNYEIQVATQKSGYTLAFGTKSGSVSNSNNRYDINRINIHEQKTRNNPLLLMSLLGFF